LTPPKTLFDAAVLASAHFDVAERIPVRVGLALEHRSTPYPWWDVLPPIELHLLLAIAVTSLTIV
jgi:hypothetical protein